MKLSNTLRRAGLAAVALAVTVAVGWAANLSFSTGAFFIPGPRLIDGSDLNVMVNAINTINSGTLPGDPTLIGSAVNKLSITSGATGVGPRITVGGTTSDTNIGVLMAGKGTGAAHLGGTLLSNASLRVPTVASAVNQVQIEGAVTSGVPLVHVGGSLADTNIGIALYGNGTGATLIGGNTTTLAGLQVAQTASRVNDFVLTPGATSSAPTFLAGGAGSDATVGATLGTAGTGTVTINTGSSVPQFAVSHTASAVDYLSCTGVTTANPAHIPCTATGSDTNVGISLVTKGSGNVKLGSTSAVTCNGTTTATCQGQRLVVSVTGLSTAAGSESAAMTVTDANVVSSSALVQCQVNGYSGTGKPLIYNVVPGTGSFSFTVLNVATSGNLNATVPVACVVFGT